jgi:hypothetical protein
MISCFSVELPGIEPAPKMVMSCGNGKYSDAKVPETTCAYAGGVDGIDVDGIDN